jgi:thiamine kinase-like enzyme
VSGRDRTRQPHPLTSQRPAQLVSGARREEVLGFLARIPQLRDLSPEGISIVELDATTNRNFGIDSPAGQFALRLPKQDPAEFVDRKSELEATRMAAEAGIGAPVVYGDEAGLMVTRWLDGARPLSGRSISRNADVLKRAACSLARLHSSPIVFPRRFDACAIIDNYQGLLAERGGAGEPWSASVSAALDRTCHSLLHSPLPSVPSHGDPVPANFLDDGQTMTLIDWEYAGMNDPAWDLGYFALESGLNAEQTEGLLLAYADPRVSFGRLRAFQLLAACVGVLWADLRRSLVEDRSLADWRKAKLAVAEALAKER